MAARQIAWPAAIDNYMLRSFICSRVRPPKVRPEIGSAS
jgi:hypothetical protein